MYKKGDDNSNGTNHQGILVLQIGYKILHVIIFSSLTPNTESFVGTTSVDFDYEMK
jgi:hypothetical protein